ncbi:MAG TPA: hypothetical protein VF699_11105 [Caulobacteraceae bacterium]|jgi:hypothetical protein
MVAEHAQELSILRLIRASGGFHAGAFADEAARERCVLNGWVVAEGETGYALTLEGSCRLRPAAAA